MRKGAVFPSTVDADVRSQIENRLLHVQTRIPSFQSFRRDTVYFKPCAEIMRKFLIPTPRKDEQLEDRYDFIYDGLNFRRDYCDLWTFAMRHCWRIKNVSGRSCIVRRTGKVCEAASSLWAEFAREAERLKFHAPGVETEVARSPTTEGVDMGASAIPALSTNNDKLASKYQRRARHEPDHVTFQDVLRISSIYRDPPPTNLKAHISSFCIVRDVFKAFLGSALPDVTEARGTAPDENVVIIDPTSVNARCNHRPSADPVVSAFRRTSEPPQTDIQTQEQSLPVDVNSENQAEWAQSRMVYEITPDDDISVNEIIPLLPS